MTAISSIGIVPEFARADIAGAAERVSEGLPLIVKAENDFTSDFGPIATPEDSAQLYRLIGPNLRAHQELSANLAGALGDGWSSRYESPGNGQEFSPHTREHLDGLNEAYMQIHSSTLPRQAAARFTIRRYSISDALHEELLGFAQERKEAKLASDSGTSIFFSELPIVNRVVLSEIYRATILPGQAIIYPNGYNVFDDDENQETRSLWTHEGMSVDLQNHMRRVALHRYTALSALYRVQLL